MTFRRPWLAAALLASLAVPALAQTTDPTVVALQNKLGQCALQEITAPINFKALQDQLAAATKRAEEAEAKLKAAEKPADQPAPEPGK